MSDVLTQQMGTQVMMYSMGRLLKWSFERHYYIFLNLTDAPKITGKLPDDPNIRLTSGDSQTITVEYDQGYPPAQVEWSKDGHLVNIPDPCVTIDNDKTTFTLTNNDPSVRGTYEVKVANSMGNGDTAMYIVEAECKLLCRVDLPGYS